MKTLEEMIAVMQAAKEGKEIEYCPRGGSWHDIKAPTWDWAFHDYRVRPQEPRKVMVSYYGDDPIPKIAYDPVLESGRFGNESGARKLVEFIELTPEIRQKLGL